MRSIFRVLVSLVLPFNLFSGTGFEPIYMSGGTLPGLQVVYITTADATGGSFGDPSANYYAMIASRFSDVVVAVKTGFVEIFDGTQNPPVSLASVPLTGAGLGDVITTNTHTIAIQRNNNGDNGTAFPIYVVTSAGLVEVSRITASSYQARLVVAITGAQCVNMNGSNTYVYVGTSDGKIHAYSPSLGTDFIRQTQLFNINAIISNDASALYAFEFTYPASYSYFSEADLFGGLMVENALNPFVGLTTTISDINNFVITLNNVDYALGIAGSDSVTNGTHLFLFNLANSMQSLGALPDLWEPGGDTNKGCVALSSIYATLATQPYGSGDGSANDYAGPPMFASFQKTNVGFSFGSVNTPAFTIIMNSPSTSAPGLVYSIFH